MLQTAHLDDRGAPLLSTSMLGPLEQDLVQAQRMHLADPVHVRVEERVAVGDNGVARP